MAKFRIVVILETKWLWWRWLRRCCKKGRM